MTQSDTGFTPWTITRAIWRESAGKPFLAFGLGLVLLPLPWGSNRDWLWPLGLLWFSLTSLWLARKVLSGRWVVPDLKPLRWAFWALLAWLLVGLLHWLPLPGLGHQPVMGIGAGWPALSADPAASLLQWLKTLMYAQVFMLTLLLARTRVRLKWLLGMLVLSGTVQALWGSFAMLTGSDSAFMGARAEGAGRAAGSFINPNHLAGYLEMCLAIGIGWMVAELQGQRQSESWRARLREWAALLLSGKARLRLALVLMVVGLVLTGSRSGNIAFMLALTVTGALALLLMQRPTKPLVIFLASIVLVDVLVVGTWFGADRVIESVSRQTTAMDGAAEPSSGSLDPERRAVTQETLSMWLDAPWLGHGGGSFRSVFPAYQDEDVGPSFFDHAHNDYAQLLAEYGVLGALPMLLLIGGALALSCAAMRKRHDRGLQGLAFSATLGILALLVHSATDFNLQIPANAATFAVLLALALLSISLDHHELGERSARSSRSTHATSSAALLAALLFLSALPAGACEQTLVRQDFVPPTDLRAFEARIEAARARVKEQAQQELAREQLAIMAIDGLLLAARQEAQGRAEQAAELRAVVERRLPDTAWRIGQKAKQGQAAAQFARAEMTRLGLLVPIDAAAACRDYTLAAAGQGSPATLAQFRLALCVAGQQQADSLKWMQAAAAANHPAAQEALGLVCLRANPPNEACALDWFCRAAQLGRPSAALAAGWLLTGTEATEPRYGAALGLYEQALADGESRAANNLGEMHERGLGVSVDRQRALSYYRQAARAGIAEGQLNVVRLLLPEARQAAVAAEISRMLDAARSALPDQTAELERAYATAKSP